MLINELTLCPLPPTRAPGHRTSLSGNEGSSLACQCRVVSVHGGLGSGRHGGAPWLRQHSRWRYGAVATLFWTTRCLVAGRRLHKQLCALLEAVTCASPKCRHSNAPLLVERLLRMLGAALRRALGRLLTNSVAVFMPVGQTEDGSTGPARMCAETKTSVLRPAARHSALAKGTPPQTSDADAGPVLCVPLNATSTCLGIIHIRGLRTDQAGFNVHEIYAGALMAAIASAALHGLRELPHTRAAMDDRFLHVQELALSGRAGPARRSSSLPAGSVHDGPPEGDRTRSCSQAVAGPVGLHPGSDGSTASHKPIKTPFARRFFRKTGGSLRAQPPGLPQNVRSQFPGGRPGSGGGGRSHYLPEAALDPSARVPVIALPSGDVSFAAPAPPGHGEGLDDGTHSEGLGAGGHIPQAPARSPGEEVAHVPSGARQTTPDGTSSTAPSSSARSAVELVIDDHPLSPRTAWFRLQSSGDRRPPERTAGSQPPFAEETTVAPWLAALVGPSPASVVHALASVSLAAAHAAMEAPPGQAPAAVASDGGVPPPAPGAGGGGQPDGLARDHRGTPADKEERRRSPTAASSTLRACMAAVGAGRVGPRRAGTVDALPVSCPRACSPGPSPWSAPALL